MAEREKEAIETDEGGGGGAFTAILLVATVLFVLFLMFGSALMTGGDTSTIDVKIDAPATGAGGAN